MLLALLQLLFRATSLLSSISQLLMALSECRFNEWVSTSNSRNHYNF